MPFAPLLSATTLQLVAAPQGGTGVSTLVAAMARRAGKANEGPAIVEVEPDGGENLDLHTQLSTPEWHTEDGERYLRMVLGKDWRVAPFAVMPPFLAPLNDRRIFLDGSTLPPTWRIDALIAATTPVIVFAPEPESVAALHRMIRAVYARMMVLTGLAPRDEPAVRWLAEFDGDPRRRPVAMTRAAAEEGDDGARQLLKATSRFQPRLVANFAEMDEEPGLLTPLVDMLRYHYGFPAVALGALRLDVERMRSRRRSAAWHREPAQATYPSDVERLLQRLDGLRATSRGGEAILEEEALAPIPSTEASLLFVSAEGFGATPSADWPLDPYDTLDLPPAADGPAVRRAGQRLEALTLRNHPAAHGLWSADASTRLAEAHRKARSLLGHAEGRMAQRGDSESGLSAATGRSMGPSLDEGTRARSGAFPSVGNDSIGEATGSEGTLDGASESTSTAAPSPALAEAVATVTVVGVARSAGTTEAARMTVGGSAKTDGPTSRGPGGPISSSTLAAAAGHAPAPGASGSRLPTAGSVMSGSGGGTMSPAAREGRSSRPGDSSGSRIPATGSPSHPGRRASGAGSVGATSSPGSARPGGSSIGNSPMGGVSPQRGVATGSLGGSSRASITPVAVSAALGGSETTEFSGPYIRRTRDTQHVTLEQLSDRTKISKTNLRAIEEEDYGALPQPVYVLGYLRAVAEALRLNADKLCYDWEQRRKRAMGQ